jgi:hypothetical protein
MLSGALAVLQAPIINTGWFNSLTLLCEVIDLLRQG